MAKEAAELGMTGPKDLASILARVVRIHDACANPAHAALRGQGWLPEDTTAFTAAILALGGADTSQEGGKEDRKDATGDLIDAANTLYDQLLTLQNAANNEHPDDAEPDEVNDSIRARYRLGLFPPADDAPVAAPAPAPAEALPGA